MSRNRELRRNGSKSMISRRSEKEVAKAKKHLVNDFDREPQRIQLLRSTAAAN